MAKKKDVMESILGADDKEFESSTRELDCLIYRTGNQASKKEVVEPASPASWKASKGNVSVEIWEGKAKIKIKVGSGEATHVSMRKLASIAVDAIMAELEKEGS
ncbi:MAG: hypothetical protein HUK40_17050 [Desulfobacter sp.]|nr:hypothetical protein [Desulfobacter sp.]WDP86938.1 MAG: hypothetical protein HUN05_18905 [Desulfobacter sp.]